MSQNSGFGQQQGQFPGGPPQVPPPGMGPVGGMGAGGMPPGGWGGGGGYSMQPVRRMSVAAVVSLIFGCIFCFPFIPGLVAVITGVVGIASTRNPMVRGRVMAIIGLLLGLASLLLWGGASVAVRNFWMQNTTADRAFVSAWVSELAANDVTGAQKDSSLQGNSPSVQSLATSAQSWGTLQGVTADKTGSSSLFGNYFMLEIGRANFSSGPHPFVAMVTKRDGKPNMTVFQWK